MGLGKRGLHRLRPWRGLGFAPASAGGATRVGMADFNAQFVTQRLQCALHFPGLRPDQRNRWQWHIQRDVQDFDASELLVFFGRRSR